MSEFNMEELVYILRSSPEYKEGHHMGRPFMSAYQIAIHYAQRNPGHHLPIGGAGVEAHQSLAQRIARFLSAAIKNGYPGIEGAFISHNQLKNMVFQCFDGSKISVSTLGSEKGHSIFRMCD